MRNCSPKLWFFSVFLSVSVKTLIKNLVFLARFFKLCRSLVFLRVLCGFYLALVLALWPLFPQCPLWFRVCSDSFLRAGGFDRAHQFRDLRLWVPPHCHGAGANNVANA